MFIDHIGFAVDDYELSKRFYTQCLAPLELELIIEVGGWAGFGHGEKAELWFGEAEQAQLPMHIAFVAEDHARVDRFYRAGVDAGARDNSAPVYARSTLNTITARFSSTRTATTSKPCATCHQPPD